MKRLIEDDESANRLNHAVENFATFFAFLIAIRSSSRNVLHRRDLDSRPTICSIFRRLRGECWRSGSLKEGPQEGAQDRRLAVGSHPDVGRQ